MSATVYSVNAVVQFFPSQVHVFGTGMGIDFISSSREASIQ